jgi:hypothetical protein
MSLDSVELVVEFEKYFGLAFPDLEIEKVVTVQDMVNLVAKRLKITKKACSKQYALFVRIQGALLEMQLDASGLELKTPIFKILDPEDSNQWREFVSLMQLEVPRPHTEKNKERTGFFKRFNRLTWHVNYDWRALNVEQFIMAIAAKNHKQLVGSYELSTLFEIEVVIVGITYEHTLVDIYEIQPGVSFANGLGID